MSNAVTRAADALGILPRPETMYARTNVNVRTGPGTNYASIGVLSAGATVPVVQEKNGWYWIRYGSGHAWVNSAYLIAGTPAPQEAPEASPPATGSLLATTAAGRGQTQQTATEEKILTAEGVTNAQAETFENFEGADEISSMSPAPQIVGEIGGYDVLTPAEVELAENSPTTTPAPRAAAPTTTLQVRAVAALPVEPQADQSDAVAENDPAAMPGDASASATPIPAIAGAEDSSRPGEAADLGGDVEVAGITFRWGMSPSAAAARYGDRAQRVEANGAVWLQASKVSSGVTLPVEWFDLRYCSNRLCGVHHVVNDVEGDKKIGDQIASTFTGSTGARPRISGRTSATDGCACGHGVRTRRACA